MVRTFHYNHAFRDVVGLFRKPAKNLFDRYAIPVNGEYLAGLDTLEHIVGHYEQALYPHVIQSILQRCGGIMLSYGSEEEKGYTMALIHDTDRQHYTASVVTTQGLSMFDPLSCERRKREDTIPFENDTVINVQYGSQVGNLQCGVYSLIWALSHGRISLEIPSKEIPFVRRVIFILYLSGLAVKPDENIFEPDNFTMQQASIIVNQRLSLLYSYARAPILYSLMGSLQNITDKETWISDQFIYDMERPISNMYQCVRFVVLSRKTEIDKNPEFPRHPNSRSPSTPGTLSGHVFYFYVSNNHWRLAHLTSPSENRYNITWFDPLGDVWSEEDKGVIRTDMETRFYRHETLVHTTLSTRVQNDTYSCGIYCLSYVLWELEGDNVPFTSFDDTQLVNIRTKFQFMAALLVFIPFSPEPLAIYSFGYWLDKLEERYVE